MPESTQEEAYAAVYGGDTLVFGRGNTVPLVYDGKALNESYRGIETDEYSFSSQVPWYSSRGSIVSVVVKDAVSPVSCAWWFNDMTKCTSMNLAKLDTSSVTNMSSMFSDCNDLTSLDVSNFDTSNVTNMSGMFEYCEVLTSLDVSGFNTSKVTDMSSMFYGCKVLTSLDLSNFNTSSVTNMSSMFINCKVFTSLNLSNFNTSSVTDMSDMFYGCIALKSLDVSSFDTGSVKYMRCMFYNCKALTSLDVSNFNTSNVTSMYGMFSYCKALKSLDVSSFNTGNVANMSNMFYNCNALTSLDLSNFNTSSVTNMSSMFSDCNDLTSLDVSNFDTSNVTDMSNMFQHCEALTSLNVSSFDTSNVTGMSFMFENCDKLTTVTLGDSFSFSGNNGVSGERMTNLYSPEGSGKIWKSSKDGKSYTPDTVPNCIAATYTAAFKEAITTINAWLKDETGSAATLCIRTKVYSTADGISGWGIAAQCGYDESGDAEPTEVGSGVLNYGDVVIDRTSTWNIKKTHEGWTANCFAKSFGKVVDNCDAYPIENEVRCSLDIPATTAYYVSYNANGGSGAPSGQIKWHDETLVLSDTKPTRTGHTFKGWGTSASDTTVDYAVGASYTGNAALLLYAIWEPNKYTVRYDSNGGTGAPANQDKTYGQTLVLSATKPTRTGYNFKGWATSKTGSVAYQPSGNYTDNKAVTLYAVWEIKKYTISYDANGGCDIPESQIKEYGQTIIIPESNPFKDKHIFLGWATSSTGDVTYVAGDNYTANSNITLYAVWKRMGIMRVLNENWIYDEACNEQITGVTTSGTGDAYTAIVKGVEALASGIGFTMIPHVSSTSISPTLNVNGFGAKNMRQRLSSGSSATIDGSSVGWLAANKPIKVIYDGAYWVVDFTAPDANNLYGVVPVSSGGTGEKTLAKARNAMGLGDTTGAVPVPNGGTGATTAAKALNNLGITWGTAEAPATGTPNSIYIQIN